MGMAIQLVAPVVIFTVLVLALTALVLAARHRLEPSGRVAITLSDGRTLIVDAGDKLLWALAAHGIHLPAACGGRGMCGQCRVTVRSGGGQPLPTETAQLRDAERAAGIRLACMVKVREPLEIVVPASALHVQRWTCTVVANRHVATYMKELVLELPGTERIRFAAGEYVLLAAPPHRLAFRDFAIAPEYRDDWQRNGLLDLESETAEPVVRAYSLANPPQQDRQIALVVRLATPPASAPLAPPGRASSYVFSLEPGDKVDISGPFGDFRATDTHKEMLLIAGGAGIAPLHSIVLDQLARGTGRKLSLWYGARDAADLCYQDTFRAAAAAHPNFTVHIALSSPRHPEAWSGDTGFIHRVVYERYLKNHPAPQDVEYYLCGPPVMTAAVVHTLEQLGVDRRNVYFDDFGS
jgi:Na+-transporting NADH:ubiquinone oxidoreductase subunit F